jgi:hypothetical protein
MQPIRQTGQQRRFLNPPGVLSGSPRVWRAAKPGVYESESPVLSPNLEDVVIAYRAIPKEDDMEAEELQVKWLRTIVSQTYDKKLSEIPLTAVPRLWLDFMTHRHRGTLDVNKPTPANVRINEAVRFACAIFAEKLRPHYWHRGISIPEDAVQVLWLPVMDTEQADLEDAVLRAGWSCLKGHNLPLWRALGLARFAGLRPHEIMACRGTWIVKHAEGWRIEILDRPEEAFWTAAGRKSRRQITDDELLQDLLTVPVDEYVISTTDTSRDRWFENEAHVWLQRFSTSPKPLQRLRAAYEEDARHDSAKSMDGAAKRQSKHRANGNHIA